MATEIIGRKEELAELRRFLDAADRVPAAFLMEGEPGIGKTVLWRAGVELARARHHRALVSPPVALTLHVFARILAEIGRAEDEDLEALRPALVASPRAGRDAYSVRP